MRILLTYICLIGVLLTAYPNILSAQFNGGNGNGYTIGNSIAYCTPSVLPQITNISIGGNSDGYNLGSNLTYCTPSALPQITNIALGGNEDGYGLGSNLTYCIPTALPQLTNIVFGGNEDGYGLGSNLTYCTPIALPQLTNIVIGGSNDGFSKNEVNYCTPVASYSISASSATATSPICLSQSSTLGLIGGSLESGANWFWYTGSCGGTYVISGIAPILTPTVTTTYYLRAEGASNTTTCVSITVTVNTQSTAPTSASASPTSINSGSSSTLSFTGGSLGGGANWFWYTGSCGGTLVGTGTLTNQSPTVTTIYYIRAEGSCNSTLCISTTIIVNSPCTSSTPAVGGSIALSDVCGGVPNTLGVTGGTLGTNADWYWYTGSCGTGLVASGATTILSPTASISYYVRAEGTCNTTTCFTLFVNLLPPSVAPTSINASLLTMCTGDSTTLGLNGGILGAGANWYWYKGSCGNNFINNGDSIIESPTLMFTTYYLRGEGMCNTTNCVSVIITVNTVSVAPSTLNATSILCNGTNDTISKTGGILGTNANWYWYSGSCGGTFLGYGDTLIINQTVSTTYYLRAQGQCNTTSCASITILIATPTGYSICGTFTYPNTVSTVLDSVWVFLKQNGVKLDSIQANINGQYCFYNVSNGTYIVNATTHKPWGGVNVTDAVRVKKHFSGAILFTTSYTIHAGDVNSTNFVNVTDAVQICKRFAGSMTSFVRGDWDFEKPFGGDTITVSNPGLNDTVVVNNGNVSQDFKGVCIGDVNGSYTPLPGAKESPKVILNYNDIKTLNTNEYFELPITIKDNLSTSGISLILNYPKDLVSINNVECSICNDNEELFYNISDKELRIGLLSNASPLILNYGDKVFNIGLKTTSNFKQGDIINFRVANNNLCEFADENGEPISNVILNINSIEHSSGIGTTLNNDNNNMFVNPNPANYNVNINYSIANDGAVKITLFNILGEKVTDIVNDSQLKGNYNSSLDIHSLLTGVYTIKMTVDGNVIVKRLVISR